MSSQLQIISRADPHQFGVYDILVDDEKAGWISNTRFGYHWAAMGSHGSGISLYDCERQIKELLNTKGDM